MASAKVQGQLWGRHARDFATHLEQVTLPLHGAVLDAAHVTAGTRLLDAGCGAGLLALLALAVTTSQVLAQHLWCRMFALNTKTATATNAALIWNTSPKPNVRTRSQRKPEVASLSTLPTVANDGSDVAFPEGFCSLKSLFGRLKQTLLACHFCQLGGTIG